MLQDYFFNRHLEDDEVVSRIVHKHWLLGVKALFVPTASVIVSVVFLALSHTRGVQLGLAAWAIISVLWWIRNFLDYYLDAWIVTNMGIIDVQWFGWFHRESARILYSDIQGVSYEIEGVAATVFRYGTVSVEKISTGTSVSIEAVKNPRTVETLILKNMEAYMHTKNLKDAKHVQEILSTMVAEQILLKELRNKH